jgi:hypothetical protein
MKQISSGSFNITIKFKTMQKKSLIIGAFLITFISVYGQTLPKGYTEGPKLFDPVELSRNILITYNLSHTYETEGTTYLFEDFQKGDLFFKDMTKMSGIPLNYDCTTGDILFKYEDKAYITTRQDIDYFAIYPAGQDTALLFFKQLLPNNRRPEYLEILYNDHSMLLKRHFKEYKEASIKTPYHANREYNEYVDKEEYYLKLPNNEVYLIKPTKKSVIDRFPEKAKMISQFMKSEKIKPKKDVDLIRLIRFCDSN